MANLNIEDQPDGSIKVQAVYIGGYDKRLGSHRSILRAVKIFEQELKQLSEPEIRTTDDINESPIIIPHGRSLILPN